MSYTIEFAVGVADDLRMIRAHERSMILDRIEKELAHRPDCQTRNKKILRGLLPPWEHVPPVWELRIGEIRVFYDVDSMNQVVNVRAIRRKPGHRTTEEII